MTKKELVDEVKNYFKISELVCPDVYNKFGEGAWRFLDDRLLEALLIIRRDILQAPMTINNGHTFTQRGLRCNRCELVRKKNHPYLSAHVLGKGVDFDAKGFTAEQARKKIKENIDLFPFPIRLEEGCNWVHFDVIDSMNGKKLTTFSC